MKTVYHYTCLALLPNILEDGVLKTSSPLLGHATHGQPVVWLTIDGECKYRHALTIDSPSDLFGHPQADEQTRELWDKTRVRFTIALPNAHVKKWRAWHLEHCGNPELRNQLIKASAGGSWTWRVVEHPIMSDRWVEVLDRVTGKTLWTPTRRPPPIRCEECRQLIQRPGQVVNDGHKLDCSAGPRANMQAVFPVNVKNPPRP